jgi:Spy/CpxP family protein refolding chaperone
MGLGLGPFGWRGFLPILLDLTEQQIADTEAIFEAAHQQAQPIREQLVEKRAALQEAIKANNTAEIDKLSAEIGQLSGQLVAIQAKARASAYQLLTPEQKEKLDSIQERIKNWRGRGMRRRPGGGV